MTKTGYRSTDKTNVLYEMNVGNHDFTFASSITEALTYAESEIYSFGETIESVNNMEPNCDKLDYALAASSGALCGIIDIFLVGDPGESPIGNVTDNWFANRTTDFAKLCGWEDRENNALPSAVSFLEKKFKIPYDQRGAGDAASFVFGLNPKNHHFKSLAHNPTLLGLFFSILDQFTNSSHFVAEGELISLADADETFELQGSNVPGKFFCAFVNWFGHLVSDVSGSSGSKGRGMGIPSPFWAWTNDVIAIRRKLNIPASDFNRSINELAVNIYKKGYDARFQTAQIIPVFLNEILVRMIYSVRRLVKFFSDSEKDQRTFALMWKMCEPFSNSTVKRMLTVAHGTFCLMDMGDAMIRGFAAGGGFFDVGKFAMRLNIIGAGRFTISLYGETKRGILICRKRDDAAFAAREKIIVQDYIEGLNRLAEIYDDRNLADLADGLRNSGMYTQAFQKSAELAKLRKVSDNEILKTKADIDSYFKGDKG